MSLKCVLILFFFAFKDSHLFMNFSMTSKFLKTERLDLEGRYLADSLTSKTFSSSIDLPLYLASFDLTSVIGLLCFFILFSSCSSWVQVSYSCSRRSVSLCYLALYSLPSSRTEWMINRVNFNC